MATTKTEQDRNPFGGSMDVSASTNYVCRLCDHVESHPRGLLETGAQIRHCKACGGTGAQSWSYDGGDGGPPDEMKA